MWGGGDRLLGDVWKDANMAASQAKVYVHLFVCLFVWVPFDICEIDIFHGF